MVPRPQEVEHYFHYRIRHDSAHVNSAKINAVNGVNLKNALVFYISKRLTYLIVLVSFL